MRPRAFAVLLLAGLLTPAAALSQERKWEISPEGGYLFGGAVISDRDLDGKKIHGNVQNAGAYGARAAFLPTSRVGLELQAVRTDARLELRQRSTLLVVPFRTDYLIASGFYRFEVAESLPYVSLGAGAGRLEPGHGRDVTKFTGALGAGVEKFLFPAFGFRVDGRVYATRTAGSTLLPCATFDASQDGTLTPRPCTRRNWLVNADVTAGVVIAF
jgi:hypothetical protein